MAKKGQLAILFQIHVDRMRVFRILINYTILVTEAHAYVHSVHAL